MKRTKSLLKKVAPEIAKRQRTCCNTGKHIPAGSPCLVVYDSAQQRFCYSRDVALQMVQQARRALLELEQALESDSTFSFERLEASNTLS